jgi:hypothetical protein
MDVNLDKLTFEQFVDLVFNHLVTDPAWYWADDFDYYFDDGITSTKHLTRLFSEPEFLFEKFNLEQLEQGFYLITILLCYIKFDGLLWAESITFSLREKCIYSMFDLFERFFAINSLETIGFMWWDCLAYGYYMANGKPEDENGAQVQQAMFETLRRILKLESEDCQKSALHGLGHLKHPETEKTIRNYLRRKFVKLEMREYAEKCIAGTMG